MDLVRLKAAIEEIGPWYHNLDLGGVETNPGSDHPRRRWEAIAPYVPEDLSGLSVLDLGCNGGGLSVEMARRGAARVVAVEAIDAYARQARFAMEVLGLGQVEVRTQNVYDFVLHDTETFDLVLFVGLFYHLRHPLLVLDRVAEITKTRMYFQTVVRGASAGDGRTAMRATDDLDDPAQPKAYFVEDRYEGDATNWWIFNDVGVRAALRSAGFSIVRQNGDVFVADPNPGWLPRDGKAGETVARRLFWRIGDRSGG